MLTYSAHSYASPETVWALLAEPDRWRLWAPHIRGAWGLGEPEVERGARGAARLLGVIPVPAAIVAKQDGHSWTWRTLGGVSLDHRVEPASRGCTVAIDLRAAPALEAALRVTYGPLVALLVRNLARAAERAET